MKTKIRMVDKFNKLTIYYNFAIIDLLAKHINISTSTAIHLWHLLQLTYFGYPIKTRVNPNHLVIIGNWLRILNGN